MTIATFKLYSFLSILMAGGAIINSYTVHKQFFPTVIYLTTHKSNILVLSNFLLMFTISFVMRIIHFFFDEVREIEKISILDSMKRKMFDLFIIILIFREGIIDQNFFFWLSILIIFWIIHQLTIKRSEYLISESVMDGNFHLKIGGLYVFLMCIDSLIVRYLYQIYKSDRESEKSTFFLLFFLEFLLIFLATIYPAIRYYVNAFEAYSFSHFQSKNTALMILEFLSTILKLSVQIYIRFQFQFYMPFIIDHLETVFSLFTTTQKFFQSLKLLKQINMLPDVNLNELEGADNTCLICLSEITEGKIIGCGHIFHKNCLRELIQGKANQVCPKCRKPIIIDPKKLQSAGPHKHHHHHNHHLNAQTQQLPNSTQSPLSFNSQVIQGSTENKESLKSPEIPQHKFSFIDSDSIINHEKDQILQQPILRMPNDLILDNTTPEIILKIKSLAQQIFAIENEIQAEKDNEEEGKDKIQEEEIDLNKKNIKNTNRTIESLFDFTKLIGHSDLSKCGAISYALPKEASYNRSLEDECLRLRIELMNLLMSSSQQGVLFEQMLFGASEKILKQMASNSNNSEKDNNNDQQNLEKQKSVNMFEEALRTKETKETLDFNQNKDQNNTIQTEDVLQDLGRSISSQDRRKAWIEQLQLQVEESAKAALESQQSQQKESIKGEEQMDKEVSNE